MPEISPRAAERTRSPWLRRVAAGCTLMVVAAAAYLFIGAGNSSAATSNLRTATVGRGNVDQTTTLTGTVARVGQVTAAFPSSGRVTAVKVAVGDTVKTGQLLATMDTTDLSRSVTVAEANLVAAQAALTEAETTAATSTASSTSTASATPSSSATSRATSTGTGSRGSTAGSGTSGGGTGSGVDTKPLTNQTGHTQTLLAAVTTACQPLMSVAAPEESHSTATASASATSTPTQTATTPTETTTSTPVTTAPPTTSSTSASSSMTTSPTTSPTIDPATPTADQVQACVTALGAALAAEQDTSKLAAQLATALEKAAIALQTQAATASSSSTSGRSATGTGSTSGTGSSGSGTSAASSSARGGQTGGSVADLEVSLLRAQQDLASAQQALAGATLTAPVGGTVGAISLVPGQTATTSEGITVVAPGTAVLTASVPLAQLGRLRIGQDASVLPAGTTTPLDGTIQTIGVLPSSSETTTPTYPVQVAVPDAPTALATGSQASATITLASVTGVLTVPVSALTGLSSGAGTVTVLKGSTSTATRVTVGAVGQGLAQVTKGLSAGQVVVLADASQPLPTANPLSARLGGGGFGGAGGGVVVRQGTTGGAGGGAAPKGG